VASRALADTSGLLAVAHPKDQFHAQAVETARQFVRTGGRFLVTPLVLAELQGLLLYRRSAEAARKVINAMMTDPLYQLVSVDHRLVGDAVANWLERFRDQPFTLCDAVSFEVMRRERVTTAFAYDQHFLTAGFRRL